MNEYPIYTIHIKSIEMGTIESDGTSQDRPGRSYVLKKEVMNALRDKVGLVIKVSKQLTIVPYHVLCKSIITVREYKIERC